MFCISAVFNVDEETISGRKDGGKKRKKQLGEQQGRSSNTENLLPWGSKEREVGRNI